MTNDTYEKNWKRISAVFDGVTLTEKELDTLRWMAGWEPDLVDRMCRILEKVVEQRNGDCSQD